MLQKSFDAYSTCLQLISDNNLTIKRDVLEGMARCCIRLGQKDKALDLAQLLVCPHQMGLNVLNPVFLNFLIGTITVLYSDSIRV